VLSKNVLSAVVPIRRSEYASSFLLILINMDQIFLGEQEEHPVRISVLIKRSSYD